MKKQAAASDRIPRQEMADAALSLSAISATVILASITHANEFGYRTVIGGLIIIASLCVLNILYLRTGNKVLLAFYALLNAWVIIGFGLVNGFWNHGMKIFLYYLHNGSLPPFLAKLFMAPQIGSPFFEGAGILTFVVSIAAAYYGYKFMREGR